jgi:poly(3-hydroxybutyrate) depolymerase
MLATYPDLFAGGGIVAGLPFGVAGSVPDAFAAMAGQRRLAAGDLADAVRRASPHRGPWPRVAIWQGDADPTVAAVNADDLAAQWQGVHGLDGVPPHIHARPDRQRARWCAADGSVLIESVRIAGLAHAVPLDLSGDPALRLGQPGRHFVDVGISAMRHIAAFWGLLPAEPELVRPVQPAAARPALGVQATIAAALRTAGLRP